VEFSEDDFARADQAIADYVKQNMAGFSGKIADLQNDWLFAPDNMLRNGAAQLRTKVHEIAGLGTTFGFPLVSNIAHVLRQITADIDIHDPKARNLIGLCISTMMLVFNNSIKDMDGPKWEEIMGPINMAHAHLRAKAR
jgi:hypothetical protein